MKLSKQIACYAYETSGDWDKIAEKIKNNDEAKSFNIKENYITIVDELYPNKLRELRFPPWILFYEGDISLLNQKCIGIVGSRKSLDYGIQVTKMIASVLSNKYVLVSGLAKGIDAVVHEVGIGKGKTIGVLGCGLDVEYPKCNHVLYEEMRKNHLLISEYPHFVRPQKWHFPWRNRIIAALSEKCIVTQAKINSGTMLTVNEALNLNKDIYCVPYPINEIEGEGCNLLIQQGAQIIVSVDYLSEM
ncbi:MAG: DNA-processing protein DprA [Anaerorhabdus sp.]|uniref:DNA-processing protein DprA n=1 Tax=Anaerorhabdus sp. TaxID=1872524 RepID=UPI003A8C6A48